MPVTVVTDSAASLPQQEAARLGITAAPMGLVLGGFLYADGDLEPEEVLARSATESIATSAPSPGDYAKTIEAAASGRGTVVITVSSRMSASFDSACVAARTLPAGTAEVVDSGTAAGAQGLVAIAAAEAAARGAAMEQVAATARRVAARVRLVAALDDLTQLARSGRVPPVAARASTSLRLRMMFEFRHGRIKARRPALGADAAVQRIVSSVGGGSRAGLTLRASVMHASAPTAAALLASRIGASFPSAEVRVTRFSPVMVAHTGPGLVGAAWWWDDPPADGPSLGR